MNTRRLSFLALLLLAAAPDERSAPLPAPASPDDLPELLAQAGDRKITRRDLLDRIMESKFHAPVLEQFANHLVFDRETKRLGIRPTDAEVETRMKDFQQKLLESELWETIGLALLGNDLESAEKAAAVKALIESLVAGRPDWEGLQKKIPGLSKERVEEAREGGARVMRTWAAGDGLRRALARLELTNEGLQDLMQRLLELEGVTRKTLGLDAAPTKAQQDEAFQKLRTDYRVLLPEAGKPWERDVACIIGGEKISTDQYLPFFLRKMGRAWILLALEGLIQDAVILDRLDNIGKPVTEKEIDNAFQELQERIQRQPRAQDVMSLSGKTGIEVRRDIRNDLALSRLITPPTEQDLQDHYEANRVVFGNAEIRASHILIAAMDDSGRPLHGAREASFQWAKKRADEVRELYLKNTSWEKLVKEHSNHRASREALEPGDLGWFPRRGRPDFEPIAKVAFEGEEPGIQRPLLIGTVSRPIESERGYHLILVTNVKRPMPPPLKDIRDAVRRDWESLRREKALRELMDNYERTKLLRRFWPLPAGPENPSPTPEAPAAKP